MGNLIEQLKQRYQHLSKQNITSLLELYDENILFCDPLHRLQGKSKLQQYFEYLLQNTRHCEFRFHDTIEQHERACLSWTMTFTHPRLAKGSPIDVHGCSLLHFSRRITQHCDYFDVSTMLHDHIPLVGKLSRFIKLRAG
ncbi:MAG: hypothetical protein CENE_02388 [Candidatus Celerinatantimonas neptuna]|nr:MAG: hypothetical protein CENE_02388 [Candidatus Celerinatantimonas neptuna]